jgi:hypothetical protein
MKKHVSTLGLVLLAIATVIGMASTATAADVNDTETTNVTVDVTAETALDVKPDDLQYSGASVGTLVNKSDNGFDAVKVENTGSEDIMEVWLETTKPNTDPFGQGSTSAHDSANFLKVKPRDLTQVGGLRGNDSNYHYITRAEFFESDMPLIQTGTDWSGDFSSDSAEFLTGRLRFANDEFNFVLGTDGATCDGSGSPSAKIRIADTPNTPTSLGTYDFSDDGSDYSEYNITTSNQGGYGITQNQVPLNMSDNRVETYDIQTACDSGNVNTEFDQEHILVNRYDIQSGGADDLQANSGSISQQILRSTGTGDDLYPGDSFTLDIAVQVPRGVPSGQLAEGTMSILATTSTN